MCTLTQDEIAGEVARIHAAGADDIVRAHGIRDDQNIPLRRVDPRLRVIACFGFALLVVSVAADRRR